MEMQIFESSCSSFEVYSLANQEPVLVNQDVWDVTVKSKVQVFDTLQVVNCFKVESEMALLPS